MGQRSFFVITVKEGWILTYSKKEMRRAYIARLQQLDMNTRLHEEHRLSSLLFDTQEWLGAQTIALTMSHSFEIDTAPLILHARHLGQTVVVPRTLSNHQMEFVTIDEGTDFVETSFGVLEPEDGQVVKPDDIDLMIVPGIAFTLDGDRLGFGGGYYDRYLEKYHGPTTSLALTTMIASKGDWAVDDHDHQIDHLVSLVGND